MSASDGEHNRNRVHKPYLRQPLGELRARNLTGGLGAKTVQRKTRTLLFVLQARADARPEQAAKNKKQKWEHVSKRLRKKSTKLSTESQMRSGTGSSEYAEHLFDLVRNLGLLLVRELFKASQ